MANVQVWQVTRGTAGRGGRLGWKAGRQGESCWVMPWKGDLVLDGGEVERQGGEEVEGQGGEEVEGQGGGEVE